MRYPQLLSEKLISKPLELHFESHHSQPSAGPAETAEARPALVWPMDRVSATALRIRIMSGPMMWSWRALGMGVR